VRGRPKNHFEEIFVISSELNLKLFPSCLARCASRRAAKFLVPSPEDNCPDFARQVEKIPVRPFNLSANVGGLNS